MQINNSYQAIQNIPSQGSRTRDVSEFSEKLIALQDAIDSNDTEKVQAAYDDIVASSPNSGEHGEDPLGQFLASIEEALASGNVDSLSEVSATFSSARPEEMGNMPPPPPMPSMSEEEVSTFSSLFEALSADDVEGAQSALESLMSTLSQAEVSSSGYASTSRDNVLTQIEEALSAGDSDLAEQYLQEALFGMPSGSLVHTEA